MFLKHNNKYDLKLISFSLDLFCFEINENTTNLITNGIRRSALFNEYCSIRSFGEILCSIKSIPKNGMSFTISDIKIQILMFNYYSEQFIISFFYDIMQYTSEIKHKFKFSESFNLKMDYICNFMYILLNVKSLLFNIVSTIKKF